MAWGPGVVQPGGVSGSLVDLNDMLPTLAALAGVELPAFGLHPRDGESLLPVLKGGSELESREYLHPLRTLLAHGVNPPVTPWTGAGSLYQGGDFFDALADPLEKAPLHVAALEGRGCAIAYDALLAQN